MAKSLVFSGVLCYYLGMKIDPKNLPNNSEILQQIVAELLLKNEALETNNDGLATTNKTLVTEVTELNTNNNNLITTNKTLATEVAELNTKIATLLHQLAILKAKNFGKSSEKIKQQIDDIELMLEEEESQVIEIDADDDEIVVTEDSPAVAKGQAKRKKLPEHLEHIDVVLNPDPKCPSCGGEEFRQISVDSSETLEYIPSSFKVIRYSRPRCACVNCEKIVQAYPASTTIAKGKAAPGLLAHILVQKYCDHLPFYRQSQIYEREGVELARSTMASWAGQCAELLTPLINELRKSVFSSPQIHGDDTPVRVLAPGLGKTKKGYIWSYVRDGRPHGDTTPPAICYFYSADRLGIRPAEHLKGYSGVLHADAYAGYNKLYNNGEPNSKATITEAACWAHTRRKFYEVTVANENANIAFNTLEEIRKIYKLEEKIKGRDPDQRKELRQEESKKLVDKLFTDWKKFYKGLPKHSSTAKAIAYGLNNEEALKRFLDNGCIEIDNNAAERSMRSIALGRKNWLFAGSDKGGETAAAIYSLLETAKLNNINPWQYLAKVFSVIQDHNSTKIAELLPWNINLQT